MFRLGAFALGACLGLLEVAAVRQQRRSASRDAGSAAWDAGELSLDVEELGPLATGDVYATGAGTEGQLGIGLLEDRVRPTRVNITGVRKVSAGADHTLFVKADGRAFGTGFNEYGQLGASWDLVEKSPVPMRGLPAAVQDVFAGRGSSHFLLTDGSVYACGRNDFGQLGDGTNTHRYTPVKVFSDVSALSGGVFFTLFLTKNGSVYGTGQNAEGALGIPDIRGTKIPKQIFPGGVLQVAADLRQSFFLMESGAVFATGSNDWGQLGDGTDTARSEPVKIFEGGVRAISPGALHTHFMMSDGSMQAAGDNSVGEFGDGTTEPAYKPRQVSPPMGTKDVVAGQHFTFFRTSKGDAFGVGYNYWGQLGLGRTREFDKPAHVFTQVSSISASSGHSVFVTQG